MLLVIKNPSNVNMRKGSRIVHTPRLRKVLALNLTNISWISKSFNKNISNNKILIFDKTSFKVRGSAFIESRGSNKIELHQKSVFEPQKRTFDGAQLYIAYQSFCLYLYKLFITLIIPNILISGVWYQIE